MPIPGFLQPNQIAELRRPVHVHWTLPDCHYSLPHIGYGLTILTNLGVGVISEYYVLAMEAGTGKMAHMHGHGTDPACSRWTLYLHGLRTCFSPFTGKSPYVYGIGRSPTDLTDTVLSPFQHRYSPFAYCFSPSWDHFDPVLKWSHDGLKRCADGLKRC